MGRVDWCAVIVRATRLGLLHSKNGDQIDSVRRSFAGFGLYRLKDPGAADCRRRVITMSLSGEGTGTGTPAPLDPRRYHESVTAEIGRASCRESVEVWAVRG